MKKIIGFSALLLITAFLGCATTSELVETQKFSGTFDDHKVVTVQMDSNPDIEEDAANRNKFEALLAKHIAKTKLFDHVSESPSGATLKLRCKFTKVDKPGGATAVFAASMANAEVNLQVHIETVGKQTREVATLDVSGNSKNKGRASIGGFGITSSSAYLEKAMDNAAERIADYLNEHSRNNKKS